MLCFIVYFNLKKATEIGFGTYKFDFKYNRGILKSEIVMIWNL